MEERSRSTRREAEGGAERGTRRRLRATPPGTLVILKGLVREARDLWGLSTCNKKGEECWPALCLWTAGLWWRLCVLVVVMVVIVVFVGRVECCCCGGGNGGVVVMVGVVFPQV